MNVGYHSRLVNGGFENQSLEWLIAEAANRKVEVPASPSREALMKAIIAHDKQFNK